MVLLILTVNSQQNNSWETCSLGQHTKDSQLVESTCTMNSMYYVLKRITWSVMCIQSIVITVKIDKHIFPNVIA